MEPIVLFVSILLQLFFGIVLAIVAVYLSLRFFDALTEGIDEIKELKKGNVAVALLLVALIGSVAVAVIPAIEFKVPSPSIEMFPILFVLTTIKVVVGVIIAVFAVFVAVRVLDTITIGIDEPAEIKKGNVAVTLLIAAVIFAVVLVISAALREIFALDVFQPETLAKALNITKAAPS